MGRTYKALERAHKEVPGEFTGKVLDNRPVPIRMNLKDAMYGKNGSSDFLIQPQDTVYVPKTAIAPLNKFVDHYFDGLLMFRGISLGFGYELHADNP